MMKKIISAICFLIPVIAFAGIYSPGNGGSGGGGSATNVVLTGVVQGSGSPVATTFSTAGSNYILSIVQSNSTSGGGSATNAIATLNGLGTNTTLVSAKIITTTNFSADTANAFTNTYGGQLTILGQSIQSSASSAISGLGIKSFAVNQSTASGNYSDAFGLFTLASGSESFAINGNTIASGVASFAAGQNASATNDDTFVVNETSSGVIVGSTTNNQITLSADNGTRIMGGALSVSNNIIGNGFSSTITGFTNLIQATNSPTGSLNLPYVNSNGTNAQYSPFILLATNAAPYIPSTQVITATNTVYSTDATRKTLTGTLTTVTTTLNAAAGYIAYTNGSIGRIWPFGSPATANFTNSIPVSIPLSTNASFQVVVTTGIVSATNLYLMVN